MSCCLPFFLVFAPLFLLLTSSQPLPFLSQPEQDSLYHVLSSINPTVNWPSLYPDDLCNFGPHGVLCDYFFDQNNTLSLHVVELSFGYISDYSPNPPCSSTSDLSPSLSSFPKLRKLFFYKCFTQKPVSLSPIFPNTLEELIFLENPVLQGSLNGILTNFTLLRRLVLSGTNVSGQVPAEIGQLTELEQVTLTRSRFNGVLPFTFGKNLPKVKILDLSYNGFDGNLPESIGVMTELEKLDLGSNRFNGTVPGSFVELKKLEFLDLSYNRLKGGVPLCLGEMQSLKEVYLSGNELGGQIPEIWEKLEGILGLGLSGLGLVGKIPCSMGKFLKNLSYLGLDNNKLEGAVPEEIGMLESLNEVNLENNLLSGRMPFEFSSSVKVKLGGNHDLCVDEGNNGIGYLKICRKSDIPSSVPLSGSGNGQQHSHSHSHSHSHGIVVLGVVCLVLVFGFVCW